MTHSYSLHLNTINRSEKVFGYASNDYMLKTSLLRVNMFCYMRYMAAIAYILLFVVHKKKKNPLDVWMSVTFLKRPVLTWMV